MSPERKIPSVDVETPSMELSLLPKSKQPTEPSTPHQPTIDLLTQELAWLASRNEEYTKIIADLWQDNKELRIQFRIVEDLNNAITSLHDSWQERHAVLKEQAKNLKFKSHVSSAKSKAAANATFPSSYLHFLLRGTWHLSGLGECWSRFCHYYRLVIYSFDIYFITFLTYLLSYIPPFIPRL